MKKILLGLLLVIGLSAFESYQLKHETLTQIGLYSVEIFTTCENDRVFSTVVYRGYAVSRVQVYNMKFPMSCSDWERINKD